MMPQILSNLPKEYQTIIEIIQDKIDDRQIPSNYQEGPWQSFSEMWPNEWTIRIKNINRRRKISLRKTPIQGHLRNLWGIQAQVKGILA